eukprot:TRINITY_DN90718_c0_g1_i1.p1 TRINITY_DN90718_c0_g1~~TRINITY_DN90718_c0_g1_i1.p1  ORF type:complete len:176 (+),score=42.58 TRINITY_DN90718_c0_g1_i1:111-638(+)
MDRGTGALLCTLIWALTLASSQVEGAVTAHGLQLRHYRPKANLSMTQLASHCHCEFNGICTCQGAMEFMGCIANHCDSGACECSNNQYFAACSQMASVCPDVGMVCSSAQAKCSDSTGTHTAQLGQAPAPPPVEAIEAPPPPRPKKEESWDWLKVAIIIAIACALVALGGTCMKG